MTDTNVVHIDERMKVELDDNVALAAKLQYDKYLNECLHAQITRSGAILLAIKAGIKDDPESWLKAQCYEVRCGE